MQTNEFVSDPSHFGEAYYAAAMGERYERSERWLRFFGEVADRIVTSLQPATVLDVGCAFGFLVEALAARGVVASGFDFSTYAIAQVDPSVASSCWVASAADRIEGRYDLVTSIEMLEHLAPADAQRAIANMTAATDTVLVSTTPIDYTEPTHINVQPPEYWAALFAEHGFLRDLDYDAAYLTPWAALYRRSSAGRSDVVLAYERRLWRVASERDALRDESRRIWSRAEAQIAPSSTTSGEDAQLERLTQELWSVRDALEGALAARGSALGQLSIAGLELEAARLEHEEWEEKLYELYEELLATREELAAIKRSRAWQVAQAGILAAKGKRRIQR